MSFENILKLEYKIVPDVYLRKVKKAFKQSNMYSEDDIKTVKFSNKKGKKLMMYDPQTQKFSHWGHQDYKDYIIYKELAKRENNNDGIVKAENKRNTYLKSHGKINGNWQNNKYSPNMLSLIGNW